MVRQFIVKARFQRAYDHLPEDERARVKKALGLLRRYLDTGEAPIGLGIKKLGLGVYEFRAGLALRGVYVEEEAVVALALLSSHDEVRKFLKRS